MSFSFSVAAIVCAAMAGLLVAPTRSTARRRLRALRSAVPPEPAGHARGGVGAEAVTRGSRAAAGAVRWRSTVTVVLAGSAGAVLIGGLPGALLGAVAGAACHRWCSRLEPRAERQRRARVAADLPVAVELLAACLRGGGTWQQSVDAVADAVGGPLGRELRGVAVRVRLGADPADAWLTLAGSPTLAPLARTAARAVGTGAAVAPTLARLARDQRRAARAEASARARSAGVWAVAPLGLCFLPAFVLVGIVPAVAGIATAFVVP